MLNLTRLQDFLFALVELCYIKDKMLAHLYSLRYMEINRELRVRLSCVRLLDQRHEHRQMLHVRHLCAVYLAYNLPDKLIMGHVDLMRKDP